MKRIVSVMRVTRQRLFGVRAARCWAAAAIAAVLLLGNASLRLATAANEAAYSFAGTVVDPHGKPVAGAKVWFDYTLVGAAAQSVPPDTVSDADGKFQFSRTKSSLSDMLDVPYGTMGVLVATKDGFGFATGSAQRFETTGRLAVDRPNLFWRGVRQAKRQEPKQDRVLRLVLDDVPLQGSLVNVDGQPIADATVEVVAVSEGENGTLDAWEAALKKQPIWQHFSTVFWRYAGAERLLYVSGWRRFGPGARLWDVRTEPVARVHSDRAGRFTLEGIGRERLVELLIRAAGYETALKFARTRAGGTLQMRARREVTIDEIAPSKFTFKLGPSVPIQGRVVESGTGRALAGVHLVSAMHLVPQTETDANGRYRLDGFPLGDVTLGVIPPSGTRNFPVQVNVSTEDARSAVTRDIALAAGVLVHGRVIDERTGKPIQGSLGYFAFETNPELRKVKDTNLQGYRLGRSGADGRFTIPALAGRGIVGFVAGPQFRTGVGADQVDCPTYGDVRGDRGSKTFRTVPACMADQLNLLVPIDPRPDAQEMTLDLKLRSGVDVTARVRTSDGQPLGTYYVLGTNGRDFPWMEQHADRFTIVGCYPDETRRVVLYQPARNLVASADVTGVPPESIEIRLRPGGAVVGRLLDADGKPVEGATLSSVAMPLRAAMGHLAEMRRDRGLVPNVSQLIETDEKGRFELKGLIPGLKYSAQFFTGRRRSGNVPLGFVPIFTDLTVRSGETKDVGDVRAKRLEPRRRAGNRGPNAK